MIKTEQLRYLVELGKSNSFHKCAENLYLSQPAISLSIRNLEKELGVSLFERTPSGVYPTEIGKKVIQQAKTILSDMDMLYQLCCTHAEEKEFALEELNIFSVPSFSSIIMPNLLPLLYRDFPNTKFSFLTQTYHDFLPFATENPYSIGFFYVWDDEYQAILQEYPAMKAMHLFKISFHLASVKTATFSMPDEINLTQETLLQVPIPYISYAENTFVTNYVQQELLNRKIIQPVFQASFPHLFNAYVSQGLAAGIVLKLGVNVYLTSMDRKKLTFAPIKTDKTCSLVLFSNRDLPESIHQMILQYFQLCFSQL